MKQLYTGSEARLFSAIRIPKKFWFALGLALLMTLLCSMALACSNPSGECTGNTFAYRYADNQFHNTECLNCGFRYLSLHSVVTLANCQQQAYCGACESFFGGLGSHVMSNYRGQEATCVTKGWDSYNKCDYCDYSTILLNMRGRIPPAQRRAGAPIRSVLAAITAPINRSRR